MNEYASDTVVAMIQIKTADFHSKILEIWIDCEQANVISTFVERWLDGRNKRSGLGS